MKKFLPMFAVAACLSLPATAFAADSDYVPSNVNNVSVVWNFATEAFDISMTAPTTSYIDDFWDVSYSDLESIEKIEVLRYMGYGEDGILLHTFDNPAPGANLSCSISSLPAGESYSFEFLVYANGQVSDGTYMSNVLAGGYPAAIAMPEVTTNQGQMPVTVKFTAPSVYAGTDYPLPSLKNIILYSNAESYYDPDVELGKIENPVPGQQYTFTVNDPSITGARTWKLYSSNAEGESAKTEFKIFIGNDAPGRVNNLKAIENTNGTVSISWSAPTAGANNGYFDASAVKYAVYKKTPGNWGDDSTLLADNLTDCSYTFAFEGGDELQRIAFSVAAYNSDGRGLETVTPYLLIGPAYDMPLIEHFDSTDSYGYSIVPDYTWTSSTDLTSSYPPEWRYDKYKYIGNSQVTPPSGEGGLAYLNTYSYTPAGTFSLTSAKIAVADAAAVEVAFTAYRGGAPAGASLTSEVSFDMGATFLPVGKFEMGGNEGDWTRISGAVDVPAGAQFVMVRISAHSVTGTDNTFAIDDIEVRPAEAQAAIYPASVTDFNAVLEGDAIIVTLKAPELTHASLGDVNGQPLESISKIVLGRQIGYGNDYVTVHEFINPAPGAELEYTDTDLSEGGEYRYRALVYVGDRTDYGNYTDNPITVGQVPGEVTDFTAVSTRGAAPVVLSFRTPALDINGETLKAIKSVIITKYDSDNFVWTPIAEMTENIEPDHVYTYLDATVSSGNIYEYRVAVTGSAGNSYGVSRSVYVGVDEPLAPQQINAEVNAEGKVVVTWVAPEGGINNGYIDFENLAYSVYRGNGYSDYSAVRLASGLKETTYIDPTEFGDEQNVRYFVKAENMNMAGVSGMSNLVLVGNPSTLPYVENFSKVVDGLIEPDHGAWTTSSSDGTSVWAFAELAYFINEGQVKPVGGDNGLAYAYYGPYNSVERDDYLTSGHIVVEGQSELMLEFYLYGLAGYNQTLDAEVSFDGGEFNSIAQYNFAGDFTQEGWEKENVKFFVPEGAKYMQLRMRAHKGTYSCSVAIDNIRISDEISGVGAVEVDLNGAVSVVDGAIVITADAETKVVVADMGGRIIYTGQGDSKVAVAPGMYIVNLNGSAVKVMVK